MQRTPLATISANHARYTELTPYQRGLLIGAAASGATPVAIEKTSGVRESTVRYVLSTASTRTTGSVNLDLVVPNQSAYVMNVIL